MFRSWATHCFVTLTLALLAAGCAGNSNASSKRSGGGGDVSRLQGTWELQPEDGPASSQRQRVVKQVEGNTETVTTYGPNGQVINAHTATFQLGRRGGIPVYTFSRPRITAGPEQGDTGPGGRTYVYRVSGDEFDEVWGLLPGQEQRPVEVKRWKRGSGQANQQGQAAQQRQGR